MSCSPTNNFSNSSFFVGTLEEVKKLQDQIDDSNNVLTSNSQKLQTLGVHGKWCAFQDYSTTLGTITYDRLTFSETNMNTGQPLNINTGSCQAQV